MINNLKLYRSTMILLIFALQAFVGISQTQNFLERPYLQTSATYTTEVIPDRIYLNIGINEKDTRGKISLEALENRMTAKLTAMGIDIATQLSVSDLSSDFKKYLLRKTDVLKNKQYILIVYDAQTAALVAKELEQINISNIRIGKTVYSKLEELKIELRGKAVEKAKRQAESMLKPLNQAVGKALFISDSNTNVNHILNSRSASNSSNFYSIAEVAITDIAIKEMKVQVAVTVYFEII